jgi:hypothetical protein
LLGINKNALATGETQYRYYLHFTKTQKTLYVYPPMGKDAEGLPGALQLVAGLCAELRRPGVPTYGPPVPQEAFQVGGARATIVRQCQEGPLCHTDVAPARPEQAVRPPDRRQRRRNGSGPVPRGGDRAASHILQ